MTVFVDFTFSNGNPNLPTSLHYIGDEENNQYIQAIKSVGKMLLHYDHDKKVPMFGFGGYFDGDTSNCFPLDRS